MSVDKFDKLPLTPMFAAVIGAASALAVNTTPAQAITLDEHGRVLIQGTTISKLLPTSSIDKHFQPKDVNISCESNTNCHQK